MMPAFAGVRSLGKQDKFLRPDSSVGFTDLFLEKMYLEKADIFHPLMVDISYLRGKKPIGIVAIEATSPVKFDYNGSNFYLIDADRGTPKLIHLETYHDTVPVLSPLERQASVSSPGGQLWNLSGLTLTGPIGAVSGQKISLNYPNSKMKIVAVATATAIKHPVFRIRRCGDSSRTNVVGTGDGTTKDFAYTLDRKPICPKSIIITFTDSAVRTLTDDGDGNIISTPSVFTLEITHGIHSIVNYKTGAIELHFNSSHIPALASSISATYEYWSDGIVDDTEYTVEWGFDEA